MTMTNSLRLFALGPLMVGGLALGGCVTAPTYGTDKTSTEQLVEDVSGVLSLGPKPKPKIDYKPRPELVRPASTTELPAPQDNIAAADPSWPVSPEQRRAEVRAYATANRDKPGYEPQVISDVPASQVTASDPVKPGTPARGQDSGVYDGVTKDQTATYKKLAAESRQGSATERKYLSEPPLVYRQPEATAAADELGEDEYKKDRRRKAAAKKGTRLSEWIPDIF